MAHFARVNPDQILDLLVLCREALIKIIYTIFLFESVEIIYTIFLFESDSTIDVITDSEKLSKLILISGQENITFRYLHCVNYCVRVPLNFLIVNIDNDHLDIYIKMFTRRN